VPPIGLEPMRFGSKDAYLQRFYGIHGVLGALRVVASFETSVMA
jgi:hypothetical protein